MKVLWKSRAGTRAWMVLVSGAVMGVAVGNAPTLATPPHAVDPSQPVHGVVATSRTDAASRYWTPQRMASAIPVPAVAAASNAVAGVGPVSRGRPGQVAPVAPMPKPPSTAKAAPGLGATAAPWTGDPTSPPATTSGKVFFVGDDGGNYVCSGSTVNSGGKNLVYTAGHCVHGGGSGRNWYATSSWMFVPGYDATSSTPRPYGTWTARQLWSLRGWIDNGDRRYDIGVAVIQTNDSDTHIVNAVGGQGIEWNYPLEQFVYQFGYPSRSPFNGATLQYCTGTTFNDEGNEGILCNMTEGASGGPWLDDFDGTLGQLDSVNSWVFWNSSGTRYKWNGPYFGEGARQLYEAVENL